MKYRRLGRTDMKISEISLGGSPVPPEAIFRRAIEMGINLSINTDAHSASDMDLVHFGVATARRGWVTPEDVINTWTAERLLVWLKRRGVARSA